MGRGSLRASWRTEAWVSKGFRRRPSGIKFEVSLKTAPPTETPGISSSRSSPATPGWNVEPHGSVRSEPCSRLESSLDVVYPHVVDEKLCRERRPSIVRARPAGFAPDGEAEEHVERQIIDRPGAAVRESVRGDRRRGATIDGIAQLPRGPIDGVHVKVVSHDSI